MNWLPVIAAGSPDGFFRRALKWLLGFDFDKVGAKDEVRLKLLNLPQGWGLLITVACLAALIWLVFWLYRREGKTATPARKLLLGIVRTAAVLIALLMFLAPTLVVSKLRETLSPVVVLADASESMTIEDLYTEDDAAAAVAGVIGKEPRQVLGARLTRQQVVTAALNNPKLDLLNRLAEKNPVQVQAFSIRPEKVKDLPLLSRKASERGNPGAGGFQPGTFSYKAAGGRTYVGQAVSAVLEAAAGQPLAAIIIMSDGQDNDPNLDSTTLAGGYASREEIPVFAVPIGVAKSRKVKNIKVEKNLQCNRTIFANDPAEFTALVSSSGYQNVRVKAELWRQKLGAANEQLVASEEVQVEANASGKPVSLTFTPLEGDEGEYVCSLKLVPLEDEQLKRDNVAIASGVRVVKTTTNVLLISGSPSWEYRALRNLLIQDRTVMVSCWLQNASKAYPQVGDKLLSRMPRTREELFDPAEGFHVIILMDVDPTDFDLEWFKLLEEFVSDKMGGVIFVAGEKYTCDLFKMSFSAPLAKMLPVELDMERAELAVSDGPKGFREWPLKPTEDGLQSPLLRFSTERELTERIWQSLPGSVWSFPVKKAKPGATVLIRTLDPRRVITTGGKNEPMPVFVTGFYGSGRTAFMAFDESWRWRRIGTRVHDTFWLQCVRSLVEGRLVGGKKSAVLETDSETYPLGNPATISAKVFDAGGKPANLPEVKVNLEVMAEDAETGSGGTAPVVKGALSLLPVPGAPGTYKRQYVPPRTGYYKLSLAGAESGAGTTTSFRVASQYEYDHPETNVVRLAELTDRAKGGGVVELRNLGSLPDRIESRKEQVLEAGDQFSLWANPLALGLMTVLLGIEWTLRKRWNMA